MATIKTDIWIYADWIGLGGPTPVGVLTAQQAKGRKAFHFSYDKGWLNSAPQQLLDPDIQWYSGAQYPTGKENFGVFMDSMPDTWGRTLMKRRAALVANAAGQPVPALYDIDFLLGVYDESRMGALRFKRNPEGPFLDDNRDYPTPPWSSLPDLQYGAAQLEEEEDSDAIAKWLAVLLAPGSSLGGARPKANILDKEGQPWIAKFPSKNDTVDKGAWEYLVYELAVGAGIEMTDSQLKYVAGRQGTFLTKRFDRQKKERIHFASAMTMTGKNEETVRTEPGSYLDMALFIQNYGCRIDANLQQLWKRLVFNMAVSNTDDHLRNHGFLLGEEGWQLAPAYDINPIPDKEGLCLTVDGKDHSLDLALAKSVGPYFRLNEGAMNAIIEEVLTAVAGWKTKAKALGLATTEIDGMAPAFRFI